MKRIFFTSVMLLLFALPVFTQVQLPAKEPFVAKKWQEFTQKLLSDLEKGTEYEKLASEVKIEITNEDTLDANSDSSLKTIQIDKGRIGLVTNMAQYVAIVAHEFGHIALDFPLAETYIPATGDSGVPDVSTDYDLLRKNEKAADEFVVEVMERNHYDICDQYEGFEKLLEAKGVLSKKEIGPKNKILWERLLIMNDRCSRKLMFGKSTQN